MAERKSGPVKPPVIDLTARENKPEKPADPATAPKPAETASPRTAKAEPVGAATGQAYLPLGAAALAGGVIGAGLSLVLAYAGLFPQAQPDPRLDALEARLAAVAKGDGGAAAQQVTDLADQVAALKAVAPVDLAPLRQEITALSGRIDAVAAGASGDEADTLSKALADLGARLDAAEVGLTEGKAGMDALRAEFAGLQETLAAQQKAAADAVAQAQVMTSQLPLVLAELDAALTAGRPFGAELAKLRALDPERVVPPLFAAAAERGLPRSEALVQGFRQILPELAAAIPTPANASWQDQSIGWLRNLLALRRSEEIAGDGPEAVLSRLEGAMERRDFAAAAPLFAQLPEPMRALAGRLPEEVAASAEAQQLLGALRQQALQATEAGS